MKHAILRLTILLIIINNLSCSNNPATSPLNDFDQSTQLESAKEIDILEDEIDKPYNVLGYVDATIKREFSFFPNDQTTETHNQAINALKQEALNQYGDKVDAIIDLDIQENAEEGLFPATIVNIKGTAISFTAESKPSNKPKKKRKAKPAKNIQSKPKPIKNQVRKAIPHQPVEPEITPEELLK